MLESLAQVQISEKELAMMTSLTSIQTKGVKRALNEESVALLFDTPDDSKTVNGVAGAKRRQRWKHEEEEEEENAPELENDCNVIGLEVREESSSEEEEEETENAEEVEKVEEVENKETQEEKECKDVPSKKLSEDPKAQVVTEETKPVKNPPPIKIYKPAVYVPVHR